MSTVMQAGLVAFSVLVVGSEILRHATAVAALRRAGAGPGTGWGNWRVMSEMRAYRQLLLREGRSLRWWRLWWVLYIVTIVAMLFTFVGYMFTYM